MMAEPKKSLGQHWLKDEAILRQIVSYADLSSDDTVLEIGPGLGTLTKVIAEKAGKVVAVEFDRELAENLQMSLAGLSGESGKNSSVIANEVKQSTKNNNMDCHGNKLPRNDVCVINADFLQFDLNQLPKNYKVVANVPYYITARIVQKLLTADNKPSVIVLLVQKEVAERLAAKPGDMSILSISAQLFAEVSLGIEVPAKFFTPPPKVDSQVVIMELRSSLRAQRSNPMDRHGNKLPRDDALDQVRNDTAFQKLFFRLVKAGFSARRKKLRTSLAGGLGLSKLVAENLLRKANIDPNLRAQDLSLENWYNLCKVYDSPR